MLSTKLGEFWGCNSLLHLVLFITGKPRYTSDARIETGRSLSLCIFAITSDKLSDEVMSPTFVKAKKEG